MLSFGDTIRSKREAKGWTQKELAQKLYVSDKAISRWENNRSYPDITLLLEIANVLEFDYQELLEGNKYVKKKKKKMRKRVYLICMLCCLPIFFSILINYKYDARRKINEQGIDFIISKKWDYVRLDKNSNDLHVNSHFYLSDEQKDNVINYIDVDHWTKLSEKPNIIENSELNFSFVSEGERFESLGYTFTYYIDENYLSYIHDVKLNKWYFCPQELENTYDYLSSLSKYIDVDYYHDFINGTSFPVKDNIQLYKTDLISVTPTKDGLFYLKDFTKDNQYFLVLESDDVDIQYVEYLKGNLYVSGEKRAYGKPYVIIFELEELIKLNDIFYNGDSISLDKNVEN